MELQEIRQSIDQVDKKLKELFLKRLDFSGQVAEIKKQAKDAVYVPEREKEVIDSRLNGIKEEYKPLCQSFFTHIMEISRSFQYSKLTERAQFLHQLPQGEGRLCLQFFSEAGGFGLSACLHALHQAGFIIEEIAAKEKEPGGIHCKIVIYGDFSLNLAKAALLQIWEENKNVSSSFA